MLYSGSQNSNRMKLNAPITLSFLEPLIWYVFPFESPNAHPQLTTAKIVRETVNARVRLSTGE